MDENQVQETDVVETTETAEVQDAGAETVSSLLGNADESADEVAEPTEQAAEEVEYVADDYDAAQAIDGDVDAESFGRFNELAKGL